MNEPVATYTGFDGSEYSVLERPSGPDDPLVMRFLLPDHCGTPPPHTHPFSKEVFEVQEGSFEVQLDGGDWQTVAAGESAIVEAGRTHTFRNHTGDWVVIRNVHDPHHDFETYIRRLIAVVNEFETVTPKDPRAAMKMARLWSDHDDLIRPSQLPLKIAFPVLTLLAKLTGQKAPDPAG